MPLPLNSDPGSSRGLSLALSSLPPQLPQHTDHRLRSLAAAAVGLGGGEQLMNQRRRQQRQALVAGVVEHQPQVFLLEIDHEAGGEVAGEHLWALVGKLPGAGGASADGGERRLRIEAGGFGECDGLGDGEVGDGDEDLVDELGELPAAGSPSVNSNSSLAIDPV